jgi:hypothetical protein
VGAVAGGEQQLVVVGEAGQRIDVGRARGGEGRQRLRARGGAVGDPELVAVGAVAGREVEPAVDDRQVLGVGGQAAGRDVLDEPRRAGAGRAPQLAAVVAVVGDVEAGALEEDGVGRVGAVDVAAEGGERRAAQRRERVGGGGGREDASRAQGRGGDRERAGDSDGDGAQSFETRGTWLTKLPMLLRTVRRGPLGPVAAVRRGLDD